MEADLDILVRLIPLDGETHLYFIQNKRFYRALTRVGPCLELSLANIPKYPTYGWVCGSHSQSDIELGSAYAGVGDYAFSFTIDHNLPGALQMRTASPNLVTVKYDKKTIQRRDFTYTLFPECEITVRIDDAVAFEVVLPNYEDNCHEHLRRRERFLQSLPRIDLRLDIGKRPEIAIFKAELWSREAQDSQPAYVSNSIALLHEDDGVTRVGRNVSTSAVVAVKEWADGHDFNAYNEIKVWSALSHPNIIKVQKAIVEHGRHQLVLEHFDGTTIETDQRSEHHFSANECGSILEQALGALSYLHELGVLHRNIYAGSLAITKRGPGGLPFIQLIGFGSAVLGNYIVRQNSDCGEDDEVAPEATVGVYTPQMDIFSLGAVMGNLLGLSKPRHLKPIKPRSTPASFLVPLVKADDTLSESLSRIVSVSMWVCDPNHRLPAPQLLDWTLTANLAITQRVHEKAAVFRQLTAYPTDVQKAIVRRRPWDTPQNMNSGELPHVFFNNKTSMPHTIPYNPLDFVSNSSELGEAYTPQSLGAPIDPVAQYSSIQLSSQTKLVPLPGADVNAINYSNPGERSQG